MTKKLFKFKEWLTIAEAANHLSSILANETVTATDILELGINGHLQLSVHFRTEICAKLGIIKSRDKATKFRTLKFFSKLASVNPDALQNAKEEDLEWVYSGIQIGNDEFMDFEGELIRLSDTWDLPMWAGEKTYVENLYYSQKADMHEELINLHGVFVCANKNDESSSIYKLYEFIKPNDQSEMVGNRPWMDERNFYPLDNFPSDSLLVVRTENIRKFEQSFKDQEPPSNSKERLHQRISNQSFMEALGLLSKIIAEYDSDNTYTDANGKLLALPISQRVQSEANKLFGGGYKEKHSGLSNLNRVISDAIATVNREI